MQNVRSVIQAAVLFALYVVAAPAPQNSPSSTTSALPTSTQDFQVQCLDFRNIKPHPPSISLGAINDFSQALAQNTLNPPLDEAGVRLTSAQATRIGWGAGNLQICLQNNYLSSGTTLLLEDLGAAVGQISQHCCNGTSCAEAAMTIKGNTGLEVKLSTQPYGMKCCGMFIC